jgi:hypothetical protein
MIRHLSEMSSRVALIALTLAAMILWSTPVVRADNGKPEDGLGKYADLTATWWQWLYAQPAVPVVVNGVPTNTNPALDSTGAFAASGQADGIGPDNKYFFLAGTFNSNPHTVRTVTVPGGKTLFFPVVNVEWDNAVIPPTDYTVPQLRAIAKGLIDNVDPSSLFATLTSANVVTPLAFFRVQSPTFSYFMPADGLYGGPPLVGTFHPAVSDGYWCVIPPLPPGAYILRFGGGGQDITYFLTIQ